MAWNSDNLGPPTISDVILIFNSTRQLYPNAKVVASTMDAFIKAIRPHVGSLPVVTGEIADNCELQHRRLLLYILALCLVMF